MMALAFAWPYVKLPPTLLTVAFVMLQCGAWFNPLAYLLMALTNCPNPLITSPGLVPPGDGSDNMYTPIVEFMLKGPTGIGMWGSMVLMFVGVARSDTAKAKGE